MVINENAINDKKNFNFDIRGQIKIRTTNIMIRKNKMGINIVLVVIILLTTPQCSIIERITKRNDPERAKEKIERRQKREYEKRRKEAIQAHYDMQHETSKKLMDRNLANSKNWRKESFEKRTSFPNILRKFIKNIKLFLSKPDDGILSKKEIRKKKRAARRIARKREKNKKKK